MKKFSFLSNIVAFIKKIMAIIRNTIAKKAVFEIIQLNKTAMSQTEIFAKANNICDRVTVYRILERLVKEVKIINAINNF